MRLTDHIHLLQIDFEITLGPGQTLPRFVNVLLILGERITLVDTGVKGSEERIFGYLQRLGRQYAEIETVILSHSHPDHIGSAARIKEVTGCKILSHAAETAWIEDIELQRRQRPVPGFHELVDRAVTLDGFIADQQKMKLQDGPTLKFIHSPGHSKGSLNILFEEDEILFTADSIPLRNDIPNYDNYKELMRSLDAIWQNREYKTLLTSWTPAQTDRELIEKIIEEGETYVRRIDEVVKACYIEQLEEGPDPCRCVVEKLKLPPFMVNPIVDRAFRSHLS